MAIINSQYQGALRTQSTHLKSGNVIMTDAPTDNNGKGEAFSPTDLVCAALNSCMMTLMGMLADREGINITGLTSEITKIMDQSPRKIKEIQITFTFPPLDITDIQKEKLKRAAMTCPVGLSLAEHVTQTIVFNF